MSHLVSYHLASGIALLDDEDAFLVFVQCSLHSIDCVGLVWFAEINHSMIVSLPSRSVDTRRDLGAFDGEVLDFPVTASVGVAGVVEGKDYLAAAILGEVENIADDTTDEPDVAGLSEGEILDMIRRLPVGYRTVFNLYAIEGKSHKEIAAALGIKPDTSASQYKRARTMLAQMIKDYKRLI